MSANLDLARKQLQDAAEQVLRGSVPDVDNWQGADVVITDQPAQPPRETGFYPPPRTVFTVHARKLSWLFENLADTFMPFLDGASKIEFFGRLANAANRYLDAVPASKHSAPDLLLAVLHEAHAIRDEMEEGAFKHLVIAPGNAIWDDLVERGESSGYLGPEETRRFFDEMARKHRDA
jgi:hypothetical protein